MWLVICNTTEYVYGPFGNENSAIKWAREKVWRKGYSVRPLLGP